jgi:cytosol alanyl aminopeptidase
MMRGFVLGLWVAVAVICSGLKAETAKIIRLSDDVVPVRYSVDLTILPDQPRFTGETRIDVTLAKATSEIILHAQNMAVQRASVRVGNKVIPATFKEIDKSGTARLTLSSPAPAGKALILVRYSAPFNDGLDGIYKVVDDKRSYAFTQMEAIGARKAFPSFDEPRFKTPYDVRLTVRDDEVAIANTPDRKTEKMPNGLKRVTFATSKPLPTYLIAFAVGDLDVVTGPDIPATKLRATPIQLRGVATKGKGDRFAFALQNTAPLLTYLEDYFGVPYPYEKLDLLAVPDFGFGAMENAGAIVYREQLMLLSDQSPLRQKRSYGGTHSHEIAHQWFGNLVTPYWWEDIWLNEAFASWVEAKPAMAWKPEWQFDLDIQRSAYEAMKTDAKLSTRKIREPILSEDDIANAFDGITYDKGSGVLNMFESYAGEENFRKGVQLHMKRYPYGNATSNDFYASLAEGSSKPEMVEALKSFTDQPGVPLVEVAVTCGRKPSLMLSQKRYTTLGVTPPKQMWKIPLVMTVETKGKARQIKLLLDTESKSVPLQSCPDVVMPDVGGKGYYRWALSGDSWNRLTAKAAKMPTADALAIAANIDAGFSAGTLEAAQLLEAAKDLSTHKSSVVVTALLDQIKWMHSHASDAGTRQKISAFVRNTYGPLLKEIGLEATSALDKTNAPEAELRRERLASALLYLGEDTGLRDELARRVKPVLEAGKPGDTGGLPRNIYDMALSALVMSDPSVTPALLAKYKASRDGRERGVYLSAVSKVMDPTQESLVRALLKDKNTRGNEIELIFGTRAGYEATRASGWQWFKQDIDVAMLQMADDRRSNLPFIADSFCSSEARADVVAFFTPKRLDSMRGAARSYAQTLDEIDGCVRLKARHMQSVTAYFAK